jgi:hypothetical protein
MAHDLRNRRRRRVMQSTNPVDRNPQSRVPLAGAVVASVCVLGFAALLAFRPGIESTPVVSHPAAFESPVSLHAPAADPSVPPAEQVFASSAKADEEPSPTF